LCLCHGTLAEPGEAGAAAVDGGWFEAPRYLVVNKLDNVSKGDLTKGPIASDGRKLVEIVGIIPPGASLAIATADPVDEVIDFG
jgi:hypothetical protein